MQKLDIKGWSYKVYPYDIESDEFGPFQSLIDQWRQKSGVDGYPSWGDFELDDFSEWWGRLSLANFLDDPFDIEFVLWGTLLTEWWGMDFTRKKMANIYKNRQENWEKYEGPYFKALISDGGVGLVSGDLRVINRGYLKVQGVDLPLFKDGSIRQVLSGYRIIENNELVSPQTSHDWQI